MRAPEKAKLLLRGTGKRMFELAIDPRSRPVLAMNVFAHGLFAWIVSVLLWTLCFG
jgi:hypothetical protein